MLKFTINLFPKDTENHSGVGGNGGSGNGGGDDSVDAGFGEDLLMDAWLGGDFVNPEGLVAVISLK